MSSKTETLFHTGNIMGQFIETKPEIVDKQENMCQEQSQTKSSLNACFRQRNKSRFSFLQETASRATHAVGSRSGRRNALAVVLLVSRSQRQVQRMFAEANPFTPLAWMKILNPSKRMPPSRNFVKSCQHLATTQRTTDCWWSRTLQFVLQLELFVCLFFLFEKSNHCVIFGWRVIPARYAFERDTADLNKTFLISLSRWRRFGHHERHKHNKCQLFDLQDSLWMLAMCETKTWRQRQKLSCRLERHFRRSNQFGLSLLFWTLFCWRLCSECFVQTSQSCEGFHSQ